MPRHMINHPEKIPPPKQEPQASLESPPQVIELSSQVQGVPVPDESVVAPDYQALHFSRGRIENEMLGSEQED